MKRINTKESYQPVGPYSQAILASDFLFVAGQIAIDPRTGNIVDSDIGGQTKQVMENIRAILRKAGLDFNNVVMATVFLTDLSQFDAMNQVYATYFGDIPPARETVEVSRLPRGSGIEISMIAARRVENEK
jgi:2-iminobutanoate/2-iminopropanoate deaminase